MSWLFWTDTEISGWRAGVRAPEAPHNRAQNFGSHLNHYVPLNVLTCSLGTLPQGLKMGCWREAISQQRCGNRNWVMRLLTGNACIVLQDMIQTKRKCFHTCKIQQDILIPVKPLGLSLKATREKEQSWNVVTLQQTNQRRGVRNINPKERCLQLTIYSLAQYFGSYRQNKRVAFASCLTQSM